MLRPGILATADTDPTQLTYGQRMGQAFCELPPAWTEAHHITGWADGGPTDLANGCLLCSHHHLVHQGQWAVVMAPDGIPDTIPRHTSTPHSDPSATNASNPDASRQQLERQTTCTGLARHPWQVVRARG